MTARYLFAWGVWLDEWLDPKTRLHFKAAQIVEDGLAFEAQIVEDVMGQAGVGIVVVAYSHNAASHEAIELARSEWFGLDLSGFPQETPAIVKANSIASDLLYWAKHQAQHGIRRKVESAQNEVKRLLAVMRDLGQVELWHEMSHRIVVDLSMAHALISRSGNKTSAFPFRFELERPNYAAVYDSESHLLGHILFNPTLADARAGLVFVGLEPRTEQTDESE